MTVLERFLKQIVLKQIKGSVYLLPAITDIQINEALNEEKIQLQILYKSIDLLKKVIDENYNLEKSWELNPETRDEISDFLGTEITNNGFKDNTK